MPPADTWTNLIPQILASPTPLKSPHLPALYTLALTDGPLFLSSYTPDLGPDRIRDLVQDVLATALPKILAASSKR